MELSPEESLLVFECLVLAGKSEKIHIKDRIVLRQFDYFLLITARTLTRDSIESLRQLVNLHIQVQVLILQVLLLAVQFLSFVLEGSLAADKVLVQVVLGQEVVPHASAEVFNLSIFDVKLFILPLGHHDHFLHLTLEECSLIDTSGFFVDAVSAVVGADFKLGEAEHVRMTLVSSGAIHACLRLLIVHRAWPNTLRLTTAAGRIGICSTVVGLRNSYCLHITDHVLDFLVLRQKLLKLLGLDTRFGSSGPHNYLSILVPPDMRHSFVHVGLTHLFIQDVDLCL